MIPVVSTVDGEVIVARKLRGCKSPWWKWKTSVSRMKFRACRMCIILMMRSRMLSQGGRSVAAACARWQAMMSRKKAFVVCGVEWLDGGVRGERVIGTGSMRTKSCLRS